MKLPRRQFLHLAVWATALPVLWMEPPGIAGSRIEKLETGYMQDSLEAIADALGTHPATLLSRPAQRK